MTASAPPQMTTSARPLRIISSPTATASAPDAQADAGAWAPARALSSSATVATDPFGMIIGTVNGDTRRAPRVRSTSY
jgi:hypothetical protein